MHQPLQYLQSVANADENASALLAELRADIRPHRLCRMICFAGDSAFYGSLQGGILCTLPAMTTWSLVLSSGIRFRYIVTAVFRKYAPRITIRGGGLQAINTKV